MASRRISKSAVDWASFAEKVPSYQADYFRAFKVRSEYFVSKANRYSEEAPKIDWKHYRNVLSNTELVNKFEKEYTSFKVPYPSDKDKINSKIDVEEADSKKSTEEFILHHKSLIEEAKGVLNKIGMVPKLEEMTPEVFSDYFPDRVPNANKPTMWPHTKEAQPENIPHLIN